MNRLEQLEDIKRFFEGELETFENANKPNVEDYEAHILDRINIRGWDSDLQERFRELFLLSDGASLSNVLKSLVSVADLMINNTLCTVRYVEDTSTIDETPARQLAAKIIEDIEELTDLEGTRYYEVEDSLTEIINDFKEGEV